MNLRFFLTYKGVTTEIDEPVHFDSFNPKLKRDEKSHGITWEFAEQELGFTEQAYAIIKQAYEDDIDSEVIFLVEYKCNDSTWSEFYTGLIDFMQYSEEIGKYCIINIGVAQLGAQMTFKSRFDNLVNLDTLKGFDGGDLKPYHNLSKQIELPAKNILATARATNKEDITHVSKVVASSIFGIQLSEVVSEFFEIDARFYHGILPRDAKSICTISENDVKLIGKPHFKADITVGLKFEGKELKFNIRAELRSADGTTTTIGYANSSMVDGMAIAHLTQADIIFPQWGGQGETLNDGDEILLYIDMPSTAGMGDYEITVFGDSFFEMSCLTQYAPTITDTYMLHESLSRVTEAISNGELTVKSDYYGRTDSSVNPTVIDGCGALRSISKGLSVRKAQLTNGDTPSEISLAKLLNSLKAIDNIGWSIEGDKLRIEPYQYFYKNNVILTCSNIDKITREVVSDRCFQALNIGYNKWEAEEFNGIDGFHGKRQYRTRIKTNNAKIDIYSDLIADGFAIEATRRRQIDAKTKDWRYDNDMFIFDLKRDGADVEINIGVDAGGTLVDDDTVYNARLSPARMALRWLSTMMQAVNNPLKILYFNGGDGYTAAQITTHGTCNLTEYPLDENDFLISLMLNDPEIARPIMKPEKVTFKYPLTVAEFVLLRNNPHSLIGFENETGWIETVEYDITNSLAEFILITKK